MVNVNDLEIFYLFSTFSMEQLAKLDEITDKKAYKKTIMFMDAATEPSTYL